MMWERIVRRAAAVGALGVALGLVFALTASARTSVTCTTSWKTAASGDWSSAANWDNGVPTSSSNACVTLAGTYTVTVENAPTVNTLSFGGSSGTQTLAVGSTCSAHANFTTTAGLTNHGHGVIQLTNADGCGNNATLSGPVTNAGTIQSLVANGGARTILGSLTNTGTVSVSQPLAFNQSGSLFTNDGTVSIATGVSLSVTNAASFTNGAGGAINAAGTGLVFESGGTFTQDAGTTSGTKPVVVDDATLAYTGSGASVIDLHGNSALTGNLSSGQTLSIASTCAEHGNTTAAASFSNAGTIVLANADGCGNNASLAISAGTLTNSGTIQSLVQNGGARSIQGNVTNTGTISVGQSISYLNGLLTNQGTISIPDTKALSLASASFTNGTGGAINATGSGQVFESGGTFTEGAGTTSGSKPVVLLSGDLAYTGSGASVIEVHGNSTLSGNLSAGQTLSVASTCAVHAGLTASASFSSAGTIVLANGDGCGNNAVLQTSSGTFTNSGTIQSLVQNGGTRSLLGNLTNTGTISVGQSIGYANGLLTNQGTISIPDTKALSVSGGSFTNGTGGAINATGSGLVVESGGTFTEGAGTTSGTTPVVLVSGTLAYTGSGASTIELQGGSVLTGNVAKGQTLAIASTCVAHATVTRTGNLTNSGTILLTNGDGCGNNATLTVSAGTLTNKGTLQAVAGAGGVRAINGNVVNQKTVQVDAARTLAVTGTYSQTSTGTFKSLIDASGNRGLLSASGAVAVDGTLAIGRNAAYKPTSGSFPLIGGSSLTGAFTKETGDVISGSIYFMPAYSGTTASIVVTTATRTGSPNKGHAGTIVHFTGAVLPANDTMTITFTDFNGVVTTLGTVPTDGTGAFATDVAVPAGAALGKGKFSAKSTFSGVKVNFSFTVN